MEQEKVMKVKHFTMQNVKAVNLFDYEFPLSGVTSLGGRNNQGKTSVLNGMQYTIGGESYRPTNYTKDDATEEPLLRMEFTNGIVAQRIGDTADLKVYDENGKLSRQKLLDQFITKFALDLPRFLNGSDKDRASILLKALHIEDKVNELDEAIQSEYDERTIIGRLRDQKKKASQEMPTFPDVPLTQLSPSDILAKMQEVNLRNAKIKAAQQEVEENKKALVNLIEGGDKIDALLAKVDSDREALCRNVDDATREKVESLKKQIEALQKSIEVATTFGEQHKAEIIRNAEENKVALTKQKEANDQAIETLSEKIASSDIQDLPLEDTTAFQKELDDLEEINVKVRANQECERVRQEFIAQSQKYDEKTAIIEDLRKKKDELLQGAGLPYPGLSVENKVVTLNGKAWDCMSESMKIRVGCAIVMRINPSCKFMFVDKLEQLDSESIEELNKFAIDNDIQIIGTRVTTNPEDCTIIIKNGYIEGMENHTAEIPKIVKRKGAKTTTSNSEEVEVASAKPKVTSPSEEEVIDKALAGETTDAMKRAMDLLNKKRQQILQFED